MKKSIIRQLHIWLSIPLGLVITTTCLTGAMLIFEPEITPHIQSEYYYVSDAKGEPLAMEQLVATVEASLDKGEAIKRIERPDDPERSYIFHLNKGRKRICVDQYSGELLGRPERPEFFSTVLKLHRWLLDKRPANDAIFWGKVIVGISTLAMVVLLITGIVLWWPKTLKMWAHRSQIALRKGWRRFWYDLHVVGGIYVALLLLIMALTGLVWSFDWYADGFYAIFGDGAKEWLHSLHTGTFGGMFTRILWFIAAIIGATLPLTGYYLWIKRKFCHHHKE